MLNSVVLIGRMVADPDLRFTQTGIEVTSIRIAVDRNFKNAAGEKETDFFDVVVWRQAAKFVCEYLGKGSLIAVQGRLQARTWENAEGEKRRTVEVVADQLRSLEKRGANTSAESSPPAEAEEPNPFADDE